MSRCRVSVRLMKYWWFAVGLLCLNSPIVVSAAEPELDTRGPRVWLAEFSAAWDPAAWTGKAFGKTGFIREFDDSGWHVRMRVIQALAAAGDTSVVPLFGVLASGEPHERILAAQTLGYLAQRVPSKPLLDAARNDADAAVRLYAVDALGKRGDVTLRPVFESLLETETNGDVRKHLEYAIARGEHGIEPSVLSQLAGWDAQAESAKLGEPAPDFTLESLNGQAVRLSDFQEERAVVLVFIYGDT